MATITFHSELPFVMALTFGRAKQPLLTGPNTRGRGFWPFLRMVSTKEVGHSTVRVPSATNQTVPCAVFAQRLHTQSTAKQATSNFGLGLGIDTFNEKTGSEWHWVTATGKGREWCLSSGPWYGGEENWLKVFSLVRHSFDYLPRWTMTNVPSNEEHGAPRHQKSHSSFHPKST